MANTKTKCKGRGTKEEVIAGIKCKTSGGLTINDFVQKGRRWISVKKSEAAKKHFHSGKSGLGLLATGKRQVKLPSKLKNFNVVTGVQHIDRANNFFRNGSPVKTAQKPTRRLETGAKNKPKDHLEIKSKGGGAVKNTPKNGAVKNKPKGGGAVKNTPKNGGAKKGSAAEHAKNVFHDAKEHVNRHVHQLGNRVNSPAAANPRQWNHDPRKLHPTFKKSPREKKTTFNESPIVPLWQLMSHSDTVSVHNGKTYKTQNYVMFNDRGYLNPREITNKERQNLLIPEPPPPLCQGQPIDLANPPPCFYEGLHERLKSDFEEIVQARSAGQMLCRYKVNPHQNFMYQMANLFATRSPAELNYYRGMLAWHSTGSGKTVTALAIALAFHDAHRKGAPQKKVYLATTTANEKGNSPSVYAMNLAVFFPQYLPLFFSKNMPPQPWTKESYEDEKVTPFRKWCDAAEPVIRKIIDPMSFYRLASSIGLGDRPRADARHDALIKGAGSVIVMDEAQNIFKPDDQYRKATEQLAEYLMGESSMAKDALHKINVFALTATPGETIPEVLKLMNMLRPSNRPMYTVEELQRKGPSIFKGLFSYVDVRGDLSKYATKQMRNIDVEMDPKFYVLHLLAVSEANEHLDYEKGKGAPKYDEKKFLDKSKKAGNFVLFNARAQKLFDRTEVAELSKATTMADGSKRPPFIVSVGNGKRLMSDKINVLVRTLCSDKYPGKHYVYAHDPDTIKVLIAALKAVGFSQVLSNRTEEALREPKPRFMVFKTGQINGHKQEISHLKELKSMMSSKKNVRGDYCKIILATEGHYEGLDIAALRFVHIADPLFSSFADLQAEGRGLRMCGHKDLSPAERNVTIYRYYSRAPRTFSLNSINAKLKMPVEDLRKVQHRLRQTGFDNINTFAYANAKKRNEEMDTFEGCLSKMGLDCEIFRGIYSEPGSACGTCTGNARNPNSRGAPSVDVAPTNPYGSFANASPLRHHVRPSKGHSVMSPSRMSPSRMSPSRMSPSRTSPSRTSPSRMSPSRTSPSRMNSPSPSRYMTPMSSPGPLQKLRRWMDARL